MKKIIVLIIESCYYLVSDRIKFTSGDGDGTIALKKLRLINFLI